ncbi:MAG: choice-of-anchor D domain-containing protein [Myxococcales bacterium]|nr:choice-of-anchor D domain-containing protein [Myxococcales bacterium]
MLRSALALSLLALLPFAGCGDGSSDSGFSLTGAPNIIVTPNPIAFQALSIGESRTIEVTVENAADASGVLDLEPVQLLASADLVLEQPLKFSLVQGDSTTLKLTYTPSDEEPDSGYLVFKWRGSVEQYQVPIVTSAQAGVLTLSPSPVKFGEVPGGTPKVIGVRAVNAGSSPIDIGPLTVTGSPDFRVIGVYSLEGSECAGLTTEGALTTPFKVEPNGGFCIDVEYKPFGNGDDVGLLSVNPPFDPALPAQDPIATAALQGSEIGPEIELNPVDLNFGPLDVGATKELTFNIENKGNANLVIAAVQKGESNFEIFDDISIVPEVPADSVVAPSSTTGMTVTVRFNPTKNYPVTYSTIGFLEVLSNDADEPIAYVKVTAQTKSAKLQVTPTPLIDFGIVAEATPGSTRTVTFSNVGTADLEVTGLVIENNAENEFTLDEAVEDPMVIQPNSYRIVNLRYKNTGGAEGDIENGKLVFASTDQDPAAPTSVNLRATRAKKAFCAIKLEPVKVNFGTIGYGLEKTTTLNVTNIGSAPCSPFSVSVDDGPGTLLPIPGLPAGKCKIPPGDKSENFFVVNEPPAIKDLLQPGQSLPLQVKFAPTASIWSIPIEGLTEFRGIVQVTMLDYANPDTTNGTEYTVLAEPPGKIGTQVDCNLEAKSGVANIAAIPGEVEFAKTTVGCFSKTTEIKVYNTGAAPLDLCGIEFDGCGPEFKLKNVPPIPPCANGAGGIKLTNASPITFGVVYVPQDTSKDGCAIIIKSGDAETTSLTIPLDGEGTYDTTQTDEYTQLSGQEVDVLFIVDNSGSMSEEQSSLGSNISSFVGQAAQWQTDYHIGVVSTDVDDTNTEAGWLQHDGGNQSRFFTSTTGTSGFAQTVKSLGTNGSGTEQGLEAARIALTFPLTGKPDDPPKTCNANSDCVKPQACVPSVLNAGSKVCAGWNWEFLRPDAVLELVFVSDEEDGSSANAPFYVDFFKSIKGFANTGLFHAHSIVGPAGGCSSGSGDASDGERYRYVSTSTGGKIKSICESNWADILKDIGTIAFGLKVQFFLSRPPIPETIVVKVAGSACTTGWEYQEDTNSILFDQNHPCMPQENETIQITYDVLCYSE